MTVISIVLGFGLTALFIYLFYTYYKQQLKIFQNMINFCQNPKLFHLLDSELTYYESTTFPTQMQPERILHLFFKAISFLQKNQLDKSLGIFDNLTKMIGNKYHLKYEVYLQMGKILIQYENKDQGKMFLLKALKGFKKNKYEEPCNIIETILEESIS